MQKLKPLIPSLREKKRYIVFEIVSKTPVKLLELVSEAVQNSVLSFIGTKGTAKTGLMMLKDRFDMPKQTGIIKVNNKYVNDLKAALALIKEIGGQDAIIRSRGVSGVLGKTEKFRGG